MADPSPAVVLGTGSEHYSLQKLTSSTIRRSSCAPKCENQRGLVLAATAGSDSLMRAEHTRRRPSHPRETNRAAQETQPRFRDHVASANRRSCIGSS